MRSSTAQPSAASPFAGVSRAQWLLAFGPAVLAGLTILGLWVTAPPRNERAPAAPALELHARTPLPGPTGP